MLQSKKQLRAIQRLLQLVVFMYPCSGWAEPHRLPPAPEIILFPNDITIQQPLVAGRGIIEPFLGTNIDVSQFIEDVPRQMHPAAVDEKKTDDYQFQAGIKMDLGNAIALNFDPNTHQINTELSFSGTESKKSKTKFRLRLKSHELRLVMLHRF